MRLTSGFFFPERLTPRTRMPKRLASRAAALPSAPTPTITTVLPSIGVAWTWSHLAARCAVTKCGTL